jgi:hypothetical protein
LEETLMSWRNERNAAPKPAKGSLAVARHKRRREIKLQEDHEKQIVRVRDGHQCRWPGCRSGRSVRLEVAHLNDKGMGGDHGQRSHHDQMILLCVHCHQGAHSLHSKDRKIEPITDAGTNRECAFFIRTETGAWHHIFSEPQK